MFARFPGEEQGEAVKLLFHSVCCTAGGFHVGSKKGWLQLATLLGFNQIISATLVHRVDSDCASLLTWCHRDLSRQGVFRV
jgi:hypothetical protein